MLSIGKNKTKVIIFGEHKTPVRRRPTRLQHITLLLCASATGRAMKPMVVLPLKNKPQFSDQVERYYDMYTGNSSGWMNEESFKWWLDNCFLPHVDKVRSELQIDSPVMLILDGHSSRNNIDVKYYYENYSVTFLFLPSHASHLLQPMDLSVNATYKNYFGKNYRHEPNLDAQQKREQLLYSSMLALSHALCMDIIMKGFKQAGIVPFNENVLESSPYVHNNPEVESPNANRRIREPPPAFISPYTINNWARKEQAENTE